jgi:hypothetical protein
MKYFIVTAFVCFLVVVTQAQQNHYVYIQTENKQPFYIKMDKNVYTSTISGYLIIPKLLDGKYKVEIGYPKNEWPVQNIELDIINKDQGFILKNFGTKGWGLFNLQSLNIVIASSQINNVAVINRNAVGDEFSTLLSNVVKDPSIKSSNQITNTNSNLKNPINSSINVNTQPINNNGNQLNSTENKNGVIQKRNQISTNNSLTITYLVKSKINIDTVVINIDDVDSNIINTIINDSIQLSKLSILQIDSSKSTQSNTVSDIVLPENKSINQQIANIDTSSAITTEHVNSQITNNQSIELPQYITNSNCTNQASEEDFLKLRKKMAAEQNEESMLKLAKKYFKLKCYSTEQVKNLATLFLNDQGKYNFLDIAYPFVSDSFNFPSLQILITDDYFISRFKAMIRH